MKGEARWRPANWHFWRPPAAGAHNHQARKVFCAGNNRSSMTLSTFWTGGRRNSAISLMKRYSGSAEMPRRAPSTCGSNLHRSTIISRVFVVPGRFAGVCGRREEAKRRGQQSKLACHRQFNNQLGLRPPEIKMSAISTAVQVALPMICHLFPTWPREQGKSADELRWKLSSMKPARSRASWNVGRSIRQPKRSQPWICRSCGPVRPHS